MRRQGATAALNHYHTLLKTLKQHPGLQVPQAAGLLFPVGESVRGSLFPAGACQSRVSADGPGRQVNSSDVGGILYGLGVRARPVSLALGLVR